MKTLLFIGSLALALSTSSFAEGIEVGMTEAKLIQLKGAPETRATGGKKAIYRWRDLEVTLVEGKVAQFKFRDLEAENKNASEMREMVAQRQKAYEKTAASSRDGPAEHFSIEIIQVLPEGAIVDLLQKSFPRPGNSSYMQSIGGGGGVDGLGGGFVWVQSGHTAFMTGIKSCVDGDRFEVQAAPSGTYSYETVLRMQLTLRRYVVDEFQKMR